MRKLIKNILKENDFEWMGDVALLNPNFKYAIIVDEHVTSEELEQIWAYIESVGFDIDYRYDNYFINTERERNGFVLYIRDGDIGWDELKDLDSDRWDSVIQFTDLLHIVQDNVR